MEEPTYTQLSLVSLGIIFQTLRRALVSITGIYILKAK